MNRTKTIYFLSAIVLIIGCYALNLSYSLFIQTEEKDIVSSVVPKLVYSLENNKFNIPSKSEMLIKLKVINSGAADIRYGISVSDTKGAYIQLVNRTENDIVGTLSPSNVEGENTYKEVWVYVTNSTDNDITDLTFDITAKYTTLNFDENFRESSNIDCKNLYVMPNEPILADGMIPVVYDEINAVWVKADTFSEWYDYSDFKWANAVTVTSENRATYLADNYSGEIPMDEINSMWVWIPRFKYKIPNNIAMETDTPPIIDVIFENNTASTGVDYNSYLSGISTAGENNNYYTHTSFRNGSIVNNGTAYDIGGWSEELTGFWFAKFETSETTDKIYMIKPNIYSHISGNIKNYFNSSIAFANGVMDSSTGEVSFYSNGENIYGLNLNQNTTNTHLTKNTEWGAVAILSQSQYGKAGNNLYTEEYKEVFGNISSNTGLSSGAPYQLETTIYPVYNYDDIIDRGEGMGAAGTGASTTGTIYGVYDMSGGAQENVMAKYKGHSGTNDGFGSLVPSLEYIDLYTNMAYNKNFIGDATWETQNWYSDSRTNISSTQPWIKRGAKVSSYGFEQENGIFRVGGTSGVNVAAVSNIGGYSFRVTLIP